MRPRDFLSTSFCLCVGVRVGVLAWVCVCVWVCVWIVCKYVYICQRIYIKCMVHHIFDACRWIGTNLHVDRMGQICKKHVSPEGNVTPNTENKGMGKRTLTHSLTHSRSLALSLTHSHTRWPETAQTRHEFL